MLKTKIFHFLAEKHEGYTNHSERFVEDRNKHDKEISDFIEKLSKDGHTFISMNSVAYGRWEYSNRIRTIIVYFENSSRTVIFEKRLRND